MVEATPTPPAGAGGAAPNSAVSVERLTFSYPLASEPTVKGLSLDLPPGSRCLLIGANGAGKTTLLQLLAGKYMVGRKDITILGGAPFFDMDMTCSGRLAYLGTSWRRDVSFAGDVALATDVTAGKMIFGVEGVCPKRRSELIRLLDVDLRQRMTTTSDGQRRRVQICMGLLKAYDVLLMDEITVDMDVLGRQELLAFFARESARRGATVVYATHIFDGLEDWVTHVAYMEDGALKKWGTRAEVLGKELGEVGAEEGAAAAAAAAGEATAAGAGAAGGGAAAASEGATIRRRKKKLLHVVEAWLRQERDARQAAKGTPRALTDEESTAAVARHAAIAAAMLPSKHLAFFR